MPMTAYRSFASKVLTQEHKNKVGERLKSAREALGMSRSTINDKYEVKPNKMCQWEGGENYPDLFFLMRFCSDTGLTLDWLLRGVADGVSPVWKAHLGMRTLVKVQEQVD
jgi:transcriptional regulator with XRE-family HTH domain